MDPSRKQDSTGTARNVAAKRNSGFDRAILSAIAIGLFNVELTGSALAQQRVGPNSASNQWEVLEGCRLVEAGARDGDSFHVRHRDREYVFRLYFADAPETDN